MSGQAAPAASIVAQRYPSGRGSRGLKTLWLSYARSPQTQRNGRSFRMRRASFDIDFMAYRWHALVVSALTTFVALGSLALAGLNFGLDFTGGTVLEVQFPREANLEKVRATVTSAGFREAQVQSIGGPTTVLVRLPPSAADRDTAEIVTRALRTIDSDLVVLRSDTVGPQVGEDLAEQGGLAMLFALIGIFIYVTLRFRWKFAVGAIIATVHDAVLTVGFFSVMQWDFDLTVLGAVLAVIGYSVNDTIVVYDRIRDNFKLMRRQPVVRIVNAAVNQTLARTIVTGLTTLLVLFALLFLGGETLWGFAMALIVGIVIGTFSSVYVASAMAVLLKVSTDDFVERQRSELDALP